MPTSKQNNNIIFSKKKKNYLNLIFIAEDQ